MFRMLCSIVFLLLYCTKHPKVAIICGSNYARECKESTEQRVELTMALLRKPYLF